jgi:ubiquinone/menaquinone biosynthesis C-methylase UbiE
MTQDEMVALMRGGVAQTGGTWADFGAGRGNFTRALRALVGPNAQIYAIDRDAAALRGQQDVLTIQADFTQPIPQLPPLDGLLLANALHWVRDQAAALRRLTRYLRPGGCLLLVEYDVRQPRSYIPFPVPYPRFEHLAAASGLEDSRRVGTRRSPSSGISMYAAAARQRSPGIG